MDEPLISVHMITYNHRAFIERAIECVISQNTDYSFELVIGEDCSNDGTSEIVKKYAKIYPKLIKLVTSEKNVGMHANSLRTLKACSGKYIAYCEGDDYWHDPLKLQKQATFLENNQRYGLVFSDCNVWYEKSNITIYGFNKKQGFESEFDLDIETVIWGPPVRWTCSAMAKSELIKEIISKDPFLHTSGNFKMADLQVWVELAMLEKVRYIPAPLATYRVLNESASRTNDIIKLLRFYRSVCDVRLYLIEKYKLPSSFREKEMESWLDNTFRLALFEHNPVLAKAAKKKCKNFTIKYRIFYAGAHCHLVYFLFMIGSTIKRKYKKNDNIWP